MSGSESSVGVWADHKWHRYGLLTGVVFVVLNVVSFFVAGSPPSRDAAGDEILKYFADHDGGLKAGTILFGYAVLFGVWWLGSLWRVIGRLEPSGPRLALIAVVGFILSGACASGAQAVLAAPALRPGTLGGTSEFVWSVGYSLYSLTMAFTAAHMLALGALVLWTRFLPAWMGYIAFASAAAAVIAIAGVANESSVFVIFQVIGFLSWLLWVLIASVLLYRSSAE